MISLIYMGDIYIYYILCRQERGIFQYYLDKEKRDLFFELVFVQLGYIYMYIAS